MPSTVSHVTSVELLIDGYCRQIISNSDIFQIIKLFYLSMNGTTFKWIINDSQQLNEIFNANINLKQNTNNRPAHVQYGPNPIFIPNPSALQFDSDVFEVKIDNTNIYKFFLQIYPNFGSKNYNNTSHSTSIPGFMPQTMHTTIINNHGYPHQNPLINVMNTTNPYYTQPKQSNQSQISQSKIKNIDNNNSLLLTLKSLQLPSNTIRLILHIELYCLQTNAMYSTIWSVINQKEYKSKLITNNSHIYGYPKHNEYITWPKSSLIMNEINNMNTITFQCNINILEINMRKNKNITHNMDTQENINDSQYASQQQQVALLYRQQQQQLYGPTLTIKTDLYFPPILAKQSYRFYNFYTTNNYNLLLLTLKKKLKFEWIFDNKNGIIDKIKYLLTLQTFSEIQFHSDIYNSMFCLTIKVFDKTKQNNYTQYPNQLRPVGRTSDENIEILFGIQLCGMPCKTSNMIIQLKIRCLEPFYFCNNKPFYFCNNKPFYFCNN
eukprot:3116_1